ncbi:MAG: hypothetical protein WCA81_02645 [Rhizomicrobium sp.]
MNTRVIAAIFAGLLLCGCSTWNGALTYVGLRDSNDAAPPPAVPVETAPIPAPAPASAPIGRDSTPEDWCRQTAKAAGEEAAGEGFDAATQQKRAVAVYQQCMAPAGSH